MKSNILYLYDSPLELGFDHIRCYRLIEALSNKYNIDLKYSIFSDADYNQIMNDSFKNQICSETSFLNNNYNILIIEDGFGVESPEKSNKASVKILEQFRENGGILIAMIGSPNQVSQPNINTYNSFLTNAGFPQICQPLSIEEFPDGLRYLYKNWDNNCFIRGYDKQHGIRNSDLYFWIEIEESYLHSLDPSVRPVYEGVKRFAVSAPIQLDFLSNHILIIGNSTTQLLSKDLWWDGSTPIFGVINDFGKGSSAIITGGIGYDFTVNQYPEDDGIKFIDNLINFLLTNHQKRCQYFAQSRFNAKNERHEASRIKFILEQFVTMEETRHYEFKEITKKNNNPVQTIIDTSDEYAVAFLNSEGGRIFWGIRDDRVTLGVTLNSQQRDEIRKVVGDKLSKIQPSIAPTDFRIEFHPVYDSDISINDLYVVELVVPSPSSQSFYFTASNRAFVRIDGVKKELKGPALEAEIKKRYTRQ